MGQKSRILIALSVATIVVVAVLGSFSFGLFFAQTPEIVLPEIQPDSSAGSMSSPSDEQTVRVEVTVDTVQSVIASLDRAGSYYRELSVQTFWEGGSGTTRALTWVDGEYTYVRSFLPSGQVRHSLSSQDTVYYWYSGSSAYLTAPADSLSADLTQRIPTYEDVLALDVEDISDAGYDSYNGHPCIYVETALDELGYLERFWISVDSGLLIAAQTLQEDRTVYSCNTTSSIQTPCPTDSVFRLPDGTVLHSF